MNRYLIGLLGKNIAGWEILLQQEGVPYSIAPVELSGSAFSVIIVADDADASHDSEIISYLRSGGSLLCSAVVFGRITGEKVKNEYVKYLLPETDSPFSGIWLIDIEKKCTMLKGSNYLRTQNGTPALFLSEYSGGHVAVLPSDCGTLINDVRCTSKSFMSERSRFPHEVVSTVSKGNVRRLFVRCLELLHHRRGFPYIHSWYYPQDEGSPFVLRIDTDYASSEEVEKLYRLLCESGVNATWFVDVKSQLDELNIFKKMTDHEISLHCYEHKPYVNYPQVNENIRRALGYMREHGLLPPGYASPYGKWNYNIARAIIDNGFEYSSEFSYDYDNLPSAPWLGSGLSPVLQIPIHPVSIGTLRRQGYDGHSMKDYYRMVIDRHIAERTPVILYHHPKDGNEEVLKFVFSLVRKRNMEIRTMIDIARWWKRRAQLQFDATLDGDSLTIKGIGQYEDSRLRITRTDGAEAYTPTENYIDLNKLLLRRPPVTEVVPDNIPRIRKFNPWIVVNRLEDAVRRITR